MSSYSPLREPQPNEPEEPAADQTFQDVTDQLRVVAKEALDATGGNADGAIEKQVVDEIVESVRKHPYYWLGGAVVVGYLVAQAMKSSKNSENSASQAPRSEVNEPSVLGSLMASGLKMAKPALIKTAKKAVADFVEK